MLILWFKRHFIGSRVLRGFDQDDDQLMLGIILLNGLSIFFNAHLFKAGLGEVKIAIASFLPWEGSVHQDGTRSFLVLF